MAATINLSLQISGTLNSESFTFPTSGLSSPYTLTTSADIRDYKEISVATATATVIYTIGSGGDIASALTLIILPAVNCGLCFRTTASDADNSYIGGRANWPLILPTAMGAPYDATIATRVDNTQAVITTISAYHVGGSNQIFKIWAVG